MPSRWTPGELTRIRLLGQCDTVGERVFTYFYGAIRPENRFESYC